MSEPRAVVIGYGFAGRCFHSYLIGLDSGLALHGICSRSAETRERIAAERGCRAYESLDQVLDDPDVDLVVLGTPHSVHAEALPTSDGVTAATWTNRIPDSAIPRAFRTRPRRPLSRTMTQVLSLMHVLVRQLLTTLRVAAVSWPLSRRRVPTVSSHPD